VIPIPLDAALEIDGRKQREKFMSNRIFGLMLLFALLAAPLVRAQEAKAKKKDRPSKAEPSIQLLPYEPPPAPLPAPPPTANGSLFSDAAGGAFLLGDFKAHSLGDLVFIDVAEVSAATVSSNAKRSRDSGTLGGLSGAVGALPVAGAAATATVLTGLGNRKFEGQGTTGRTSSLNARVTARVIEVLPNGDLRVQAQKLVRINKEDELLSLSGIIRRRDLAADNSIPTTNVGDLHVTLNGKGVASADNAPGWLFRLFEKVSPF
jgi:flagellar L-ring protein precursor FlgH